MHEIATIMIFPPTVGLGWAQHRVLHKQTQCLALTRATTSVDLHIHTLNQCAAALTCPLYITVRQHRSFQAEMKLIEKAEHKIHLP